MMAAELNEQKAPRRKKIGFARWNKDRLKEVSADAGRRSHKLGQAYTFTSDTARHARLKYLKIREERTLRSRKRCVVCTMSMRKHRHAVKRGSFEPHDFKPRYEYYVEGIGWVTRQRVSQMRAEGKL